MKKLLVLLTLVMGLGLAQREREAFSPNGLPLPAGPAWYKLESAEECRAAWESFKALTKENYLRGWPEPQEVSCLYFDKRWMGDKTLDQVFTEGWKKVRDTFELMRRAAEGRAVGRISFQPTPKSFMAVFLGFDPVAFMPLFELMCALEREKDVVLIEPWFPGNRYARISREWKTREP